jgi:hypothetical protein
MTSHASTTHQRQTGPRVFAARKGVVRLGTWDIGVCIADDVFRDQGMTTYAERMRRRREH